jgi:hypothetical protein
VERTSHAIAGTLDVLWTIPSGIRTNRTPIASVAVLVLAGLAAAVSAGGLGVPEAASAVPVLGEPGPGPELSAPPATSSSEPGETPGLSFEPVGPGPSGSIGPGD